MCFSLTNDRSHCNIPQNCLPAVAKLQLFNRDDCYWIGYSKICVHLQSGENVSLYVVLPVITAIINMSLIRTASGNICACVKLLVDGIFVMAKSCPEALSREIFWHTYSTKDVYFSLETLTKLCSILMHVRRSI